MKYAFTHGKLLAANEGISVPGGHMAGAVAVAKEPRTLFLRRSRSWMPQRRRASTSSS